MEKFQNTEAKKSHIRCPRCDKEFMQVVAVDDCLMKCCKCNSRYIINVKNGSVSIVLVSKQKEEN